MYIIYISLYQSWKIYMYIPHEICKAAIAFLGTYYGEMKTYIHIKILLFSPKLFVVALFIIAKNGKHLKYLFFFFKIFYSERHRERQRHRQKEKQAPCREPDVGLDSQTLGSHPEPKADAQPLSHPGFQSNIFKWVNNYTMCYTHIMEY